MSEETKAAEAPMKSTEIDVDGWVGRWQDGKTGFHKKETHTLLQKYNEKLICGQENLKVLVPLCGKTLDMKWFLEAGHTVVGVEGVEQAILEFFTENNLEYTKEPLTEPEGDVFKSTDGKIKIYRCDFFEFGRCKENSFDAVWDRGSLVAVNVDERDRYASVLKSVVSPKCKILLVVVKYPMNLWPGPPHLVSEDEVKRLYDDKFKVETLERRDALDERWRGRGLTEFEEIAILLTHK